VRRRSLAAIEVDGFDGESIEVLGLRIRASALGKVVAAYKDLDSGRFILVIVPRCRDEVISVLAPRSVPRRMQPIHSFVVGRKRLADIYGNPVVEKNGRLVALTPEGEREVDPSQVIERVEKEIVWRWLVTEAAAREAIERAARARREPSSTELAIALMEERGEAKEILRRYALLTRGVDPDEPKPEDLAAVAKELGVPPEALAPSTWIEVELRVDGYCIARNGRSFIVGKCVGIGSRVKIVRIMSRADTLEDAARELARLVESYSVEYASPDALAALVKVAPDPVRVVESARRLGMHTICEVIKVAAERGRDLAIELLREKLRDVDWRKEVRRIENRVARGADPWRFVVNEYLCGLDLREALSPEVASEIDRIARIASILREQYQKMLEAKRRAAIEREATRILSKIPSYAKAAVAVETVDGVKVYPATVEEGVVYPVAPPIKNMVAELHASKLLKLARARCVVIETSEKGIEIHECEPSNEEKAFEIKHEDR